MMLIEKYQQDIANKIILSDPAQKKAVKALQHVYDALQKPLVRKKSWFSKAKVQPTKGLYMWGPVGTGKTYLMDLFYNAANVPKMRTHFHLFMKQVHDDLKRLEGQKNPLDVVSDDIAKKTRVLCFDEFLVNDVVDAMVLANLLRGLFERGITLLTTSNMVPDELYKNGLQRDAFLPAIALLNKQLTVLEVNNEMDYRQQNVASDANALSEDMSKQFSDLSEGELVEGGSIKIAGRPIELIRRSDNAVWFAFNKICHIPRSQIDYLELVKKFPVIFVSDIEPIRENQNSIARLLINFIDILYDAKVKLIFSSTVPIEQLYPVGELSFDFKRTLSRLTEMRAAACDG